MVVLADRDRLQKSTGGVRPVAPNGEEPSDASSGLAPPRESVGRANERRKPAHRWQSQRDWWRLLNKNCACESWPARRLCRRKAPWIGKTAPVDADVAEAVLAPRKSPGFRVERGATGGVRGHSPASFAAENAATGWRRITAVPSVSFRMEREHVCDLTEAGVASSKRSPSRGWIVERRSGAISYPAPRGLGHWGERWGWLAWRKLRARNSNDPQVLVLSVGCRRQ